jgi:hypothetical protein
MSNALWIFLAVTVVVIALYLVTMRVFFRQSKELDKHVDLGKMKEWKDED